MAHGAFDCVSMLLCMDGDCCVCELVNKKGSITRVVMDLARNSALWAGYPVTANVYRCIHTAFVSLDLPFSC